MRGAVLVQALCRRFLAKKKLKRARRAATAAQSIWRCFVVLRFAKHNRMIAKLHAMRSEQDYPRPNDTGAEPATPQQQAELENSRIRLQELSAESAALDDRVLTATQLRQSLVDQLADATQRRALELREKAAQFATQQQQLLTLKKSRRKLQELAAKTAALDEQVVNQNQVRRNLEEQLENAKQQRAQELCEKKDAETATQEAQHKAYAACLQQLAAESAALDEQVAEATILGQILRAKLKDAMQDRKVFLQQQKEQQLAEASSTAVKLDSSKAEETKQATESSVLGTMEIPPSATDGTKTDVALAEKKPATAKTASPTKRKKPTRAEMIAALRALVNVQAFYRGWAQRELESEASCWTVNICIPATNS